MNAEPDLTISGLSLWVLGREFPHLRDYWDGNWLIAKAQLKTPNSQSLISGPWLRATDIARLRNDISELDRSLSGTVDMESMEPGLRLRMFLAEGKGSMRIEMIPDQFAEVHRATFPIDQSYLPRLLSDCDRLMHLFPVLGDPDNPVVRSPGHTEA